MVAKGLLCQLVLMVVVFVVCFSFCSVCCWSFLFFFFFQAEDGIRDHCVTGVQTCALPIYLLAEGEPRAVGSDVGGGGNRESFLDELPDLGAVVVGVLGEPRLVVRCRLRLDRKSVV